jgi:hypothetical protein
MLPPVRKFLDGRDQRRAEHARRRYGRDGWLVSWHRVSGGPWVARLSCPEWTETVEARGSTRLRAIARADARLRSVLRSRGD